jgi:pantothenate kinase-related protein Tda10
MSLDAAGTARKRRFVHATSHPINLILPPDCSWLQSRHLQPCIPAAPPPSHSTEPLIIGICGPSGCGKSALARSIENWATAPLTECIVMPMDDFFKAEVCFRIGHHENPEGVDITAFM